MMTCRVSKLNIFVEKIEKMYTHNHAFYSQWRVVLLEDLHNKYGAVGSLWCP